MQSKMREGSVLINLVLSQLYQKTVKGGYTMLVDLIYNKSNYYTFVENKVVNGTNSTIVIVVNDKAYTSEFSVVGDFVIRRIKASISLKYLFDKIGYSFSENVINELLDEIEPHSSSEQVQRLEMELFLEEKKSPT